MVTAELQCNNQLKLNPVYHLKKKRKKKRSDN